MSEELIIEHCAPTLAGIKTGNMFSVSVTDETGLCRELKELNRIFRCKGLRVIPLKRTPPRALIYIYRPAQLRMDLEDPLAQKILESKKYNPVNPERCIVQLINRLKKYDAFPHEVGLFLSYPPSDVLHFMENPCDGVKYSGCWKAYSEPEKAKKKFENFKKCTELYKQMSANGNSLAQLTVATTVKTTG